MSVEWMDECISQLLVREDAPSGMNPAKIGWEHRGMGCTFSNSTSIF